MIKNPFIFTQKEEEIVGREEVLEELLAEVRDKKAPLLFFIGKVGSGRTFFLEKVNRKLEDSEIDFEILTLTSRALKDLEEIPDKAGEEKVVFAIDMFERVKDLGEEKRKKVIKTVREKNDLGVGFVLAVTPRVLSFLEESYPGILKEAEEIELRKLNFEEAKELIKLRLDRIDKDFPEIFHEKEFKRIWEQSNGNPRTILLTCASLFEKRVE